MTEIINWLKEKKSDFYVVHNSAFKPNDFYFNDLASATTFYNNLMLFIGVHHSSSEDMMKYLYQPRNVENFSNLKVRTDDAEDDEMTIMFYVDFKLTSEDILYQGTLMPPYNDIKIKGPDYKDYIGIWKGRSYLPSKILETQAHRFDHLASQVTFIDGWWLETIDGTYEISLGKINIDDYLR